MSSALKSRLVLVQFLIAGLIEGNSGLGPKIDPSFKRLESGENSGEIVNECCVRDVKFVTLGQDLEGEEIRLDVGSCRKRCSNETRPIKPLKREEFDKFLKKYPKMDPIQIFLTLQNRQVSGEDLTLEASPEFSRASCLFATCEPTGIHRHRHFSISGHSQDIEVIDSCDCVPPPETCTRMSRLVLFHDSTPYEQMVDLGQCSGLCSDGENSNCKAIRNKTVTVEGPNGFECVPVIEECQCVGNCFRTRQFHKVYDYSLLFEQLPMNNSVDSTGELASTTEPLVKIIDLGQCQGSCRVSEGSSKCLVRSETNGTCLSSLYGGHGHCAPSKLMSHFYKDRNGQSHSLISVTSCGCR